MFIATSHSKEAVDGVSYEFVNVLDTTDWVTERYTVDEVFKFCKNGIKILGVVGSRFPKIKLLNILKDSVNVGMPILNRIIKGEDTPQFFAFNSDNNDFLTVVMAVISKNNEVFGTYKYSVSISDKNDLVKYLSSIGYNLMFDSLDLLSKLKKCLKLPKYSVGVDLERAKIKFLSGIEVLNSRELYTECSLKSNGFDIFLIRFNKSVNLDYFNDLTDVLECPYIAITDLTVPHKNYVAYTVGIPINRLKYVFM